MMENIEFFGVGTVKRVLLTIFFVNPECFWCFGWDIFFRNCNGLEMAV